MLLHVEVMSCYHAVMKISKPSNYIKLRYSKDLELVVDGQREDQITLSRKIPLITIGTSNTLVKGFHYFYSKDIWDVVILFKKVFKKNCTSTALNGGGFLKDFIEGLTKLK